jgi:superfamily I DNA/RNA helicase
MPFKPSQYQEAIFEHIKSSNQNAVIEAVAGSGKTTTLIESMKLLSNAQKDIIFIAFNKHIADEMRKKVPSGIEVKTMHAFGLEQIKKAYRGAELDINKVKKVIKDISYILKLKEKEDLYKYIETLTSLVNLFRFNLCNDVVSAKKIASKHMLPSTDSLILDAFTTIKHMNFRRDIIDFADMIYIPALEDIKITEYSLILVDECQDLSLCQIELLMKMKAEGGRIIAVGDRNQSIYGFSGAGDESFKKMCEMPNTELLPLSISYRCSKEVVRWAQRIVPNIEFFEDAPVGKVNNSASIHDVKEGDFILCRTNSPIISLALQLLSQGKKVHIKGVDIGQRIIRKLEGTRTPNLQSAIKVMWKQYEQGLESDEEESLINLIYIKDIISACETIIEGCVTIEDVKNKVSSLFYENPNGGIILMTAHKSKGLEAENVHIIMPDLMPLKTAFLDWEKIQERNLHYVAITRAKNTLNYIQDWKN